MAGYDGRIVFDPGMPDGTQGKVLDTSRLRFLGWQPKIGLCEGLQSTYNWFCVRRTN